MSAQSEFDFEARKAERREASAAMIERIKKLLRLAADKRGNAHEAECALALAFELAEKHRVDVDNLDLDEDSARLILEYFASPRRLSFLRQRALNIVQSFFHVDVCHCSERVAFAGRQSDVTIAHYVYAFLVRAGTNCLRAWEREEQIARRRVSTGKRRNFVQGFAYGIASNLNKSRRKVPPLDDARATLIVAERHERARKLSEVGEMRDKSLRLGRKHRGAMDAGWVDGRNTTINQPLAGTSGAPLQLA